MSPRGLDVFAACVTLLILPGAQAAEPDHVRRIREQLDRVEKAIENPAAGLDSAISTSLLEKLDATNKALRHYSKLLKQGEHYSDAVISLAGVNAGLVADDVTGIGMADDVLLPFTCLALIVTAMVMAKPPPEAAVAAAWQDLLSKMQALSVAATQAATRRTCSCLCFKKGVGPLPLGQRPGPAECRGDCRAHPDNYTGYQCGGAVLWN